MVEYVYFIMSSKINEPFFCEHSMENPKTYNILEWHSEVDHFIIRSNERSLTFSNMLSSAFPNTFLSHMTTMTVQS